MESDKVEITWTLSKAAKSIFASLYDNNDTRIGAVTLDGNSRSVYAIPPRRYTTYVVYITPTYNDGTTATGGIEVHTTY